MFFWVGEVGVVLFACLFGGLRLIRERGRGPAIVDSLSFHQRHLLILAFDVPHLTSVMRFHLRLEFNSRSCCIRSYLTSSLKR